MENLYHKFATGFARNWKADVLFKGSVGNTVLEEFICFTSTIWRSFITFQVWFRYHKIAKYIKRKSKCNKKSNPKKFKWILFASVLNKHVEFEKNWW